MADRFLLQPFRFGAQHQATASLRFNGLAVTEDADRHLRDKIMAVLFTAPGERVNNPRFGIGLDRRVFEPLSDLQLAALEFQVVQGLRRHLGDEVLIERVDVEAPEDRAGEVVLSIAYTRRSDRRPRNLEIVL